MVLIKQKVTRADGEAIIEQFTVEPVQNIWQDRSISTVVTTRVRIFMKINQVRF